MMVKNITKGLLVLTVAMTVAFAGINPAKNKIVNLDTLKSIDLMFANGFDPDASLTLTSESAFSGNLPTLEAGHASVGSSTINVNVDQSGQATAEYPIFVGVGTAGVAPSVSLRYSSGGSDGHLGVGWSISGVTVIARCRETLESKDTSGDITPSPITFGSEDRFCLNGERLFAVSGTYGHDGTEYRTEKEQFARITSHDATDGDNNPDYFTVERKDGSISYYGNTSDANTTIASTESAINGKTFTWAINRYQDTLGNYINYSYTQHGEGEFTLSDIDYTGNESTSPELMPYSNIHFTYEDRSSTTRSYLGGVAFDISQRLAHIQSSIDGTEVRDYTLVYDTSSTTSRSLLTAIGECRGVTCLPLTEFEWSQPDRQFKSQGFGNTPFPEDVKSAQLGDTDGDGRADLVFVNNSQNVFKVAYANGHSGFSVATATGVAAPPGSEIDDKWQLIDFNADGRQDLLKQLSGNWVVHLANGSGFSSSATSTGISSVSNSDFQIVDMNGDGLADILYPNNNNQLQVKYLERSGSSYQFSSQAYPVLLPTHPSQIPGISYTQLPGYIQQLEYRYHKEDTINIQASDINGDGVADLILRTDLYETEPPFNTINEETPYQFISAGEDSDNTTGEPTPEHISSHWVVFIGNGLDQNDRLIYTQNYYIEPSTISHTDDKGIRFVDINADGLTDVLNRDSVNNWEFKLATGKGFTDYEAISSISNDEDLQLIDHNLDGFLDLVYPIGSTGNAYYYKRWNGNTFVSSSASTGAKAVNLDQNINLFIDFDGDGSADHLRVDSSGVQRLYPRNDNYIPSDKITTITNGLKAETNLLYRPLTFSTTYQQGSHQTTALNWGNGSPVMDMMGAIYVVRQLTTDAPTEADESAKNTMRYRYAKARVQAGGRGFLGFEKIITETPVQSAGDTEAKILETTTTYRQDFPYNGLPASTVTKQLDANFYDSANTPPVCTVGDSCFPPTCPPGQICFDPQRGGTATLLSEVVNTPQSTQPTNKSHFAYIQSSETKTYSPEDGSLLKTVTQSSSHDSYGNPLTNTTVIKDGAGATLQTDTVTNTYDNITTQINGQSRWHIGLLRTSTVSQLRSGESSVTTLTEYDYDDDTGLLTEERQHADEENTTVTSDLFLRVQHEYDQFGNNTKVRSCTNHLTKSACQNDAQFPAPDKTKPYQVNRYNRMTYDAKGRYIKATYNTVEQKISDVTARDIYGNPTSTTDLLGRTTTTAYDTFGRMTSTRNNLGEWSQISRSWCTSLSGDLACPSDRAESIRVRTQTSGGGVSYKYLDKLGREIATLEQGFNASDNTATDGDERYVVNQVWFDQLGRQVKTEGPYFLGDTAANIPVNEIQYDRYNRPTLITLPDLSTEAADYDGFTTTKTNDKGQRKQESKNALGQLVEVKDFDQSGSNPNYQNTLTYSYSSHGLVNTIKRTTDGVTEMLSKSLYDKAGRKYSFDDVDAGLVLSTFNAEGEVLETEDAKGQVLNNYYDNLGRVYLTESWDGTTLLTKTENSYKSTTGLLDKEEKFLGNQSLPDYKQVHTYDTLNRPQTTQVNFKDTVCGGLNCNYTMAIYYDKHSRVKYQQDASGQAIRNNYNARGFLDRITDAADTGKEYYRINKTDNWGNITQDVRADNTDLLSDYTYNNKRGWLFSIDSIHQSQVYEFNTLGNLIKRADLDHNQSECFTYDRLNRLRHTYRFNSFGQNCSQTGSNVEHQEIKYDGRGNITEKDNQTYSYNTALPNAIGTSPHQVQSKGLQNFIYDANGNNTYTSHFTNKSGIITSRNIEYTAFDKISRIYTGNELNPYEESLYRYDTSEQKFSRIDKNNQGEETTTHFIGNVEVEYNANGQVAYKRQLGNYAIITETNNSAQETYLFTDHLGSVDVITDSKGKVLQDMSFSAWGERRLPATWNAMTISQTRNYLSDYTTRGFTGHEMLDAFGIINMGGRIYDAALGRVLQADPFVQEPTSSQSFNRYTYVFNNPLSYTDPSGYLTAMEFFGAMVGVALAFVLGPLVANIWHAMLVGFASGFVSGAIITGSLKGALKSGLIGAAVAGVMFQVTGGAAEAGDPDAPVAGGTKDTVSNNSYEAANVTAETSATATGNSIDQAAINASSEGPIAVADQMAGVNYGSLTGEELNLGTYTASYSTSGIPFERYLLAEISLLSGLMSSQISESLAKYWSLDARFNTDNPHNLSQLANDIDRINNQYGYINGRYDQGIYTGLDYADKLSMATGVVGLAKGIVKRVLIKRGITVLGKFPDYIKLADKIGARKFNVPTKYWNKMSPRQQWAANKKFLDRAIARNDKIMLSNQVKNLETVNGYFRKELEYMITKGYKLNWKGTKLTR
jgi:RHS repeat-associated protein